MSCGVGLRRGSDPALLWRWHRPAAAAPIRPLVWDPPYAMGSCLRKGKKKTIKKYYNELLPHTVRMAIAQKSTNNKYWREYGERKHFYIVGGNVNCTFPPWKIVWRFLKKLKIKLPYDPAVPPLGIYPKP